MPILYVPVPYIRTCVDVYTHHRTYIYIHLIDAYVICTRPWYTYKHMCVLWCDLYLSLIYVQTHVCVVMWSVLVPDIRTNTCVCCDDICTCPWYTYKHMCVLWCDLYLSLIYVRFPDIRHIYTHYRYLWYMYSSLIYVTIRVCICNVTHTSPTIPEHSYRYMLALILVHTRESQHTRLSYMCNTCMTWLCNNRRAWREIHVW